MKKRSRLFILWLFAFATVPCAVAQNTTAKSVPDKNLPPAAEPDNPHAEKSNRVVTIVPSNPDVIAVHLSALDAKLDGIVEKLLKMSEPDYRLATTRQLLLAVLSLTSFTFIIMARLLYGRIKPSRQPRARHSSPRRTSHAWTRRWGNPRPARSDFRLRFKR